MGPSRCVVYAVLMLALGVGTVQGGDNCSRSYLATTAVLTDSAVHRSIDICDARDVLSVEVRAALSKAREVAGMSRTWWGISLTAPADTVKVSLRFGNTDYGDILDRRIAVLTVERNGTMLAGGEMEGFRMAGGDFNSLSLSLIDGNISIDGGGNRSRHLTDVALGAGFRPDGVEVWSVGGLCVPVFSVESCRPPEMAFASGYTPETLAERLSKSADPIEGYWTYFDRENDPMYTRLGGRYTLALVKRDTAEAANGEYVPVCYDILYIDGAKTLGDRWKPMMLKGELRSTIFEGHYDLQWIDATFDRMADDIHATIDNASLLTLSFPLLKTTLRFSRMPGRVAVP